jgi:energy-coupling factor transporter transmembrane protein EcfT
MKTTTPWILWLSITVVLILSTRNPIYLVIILTGLFTLGAFFARKKNRQFWLNQNLKFFLTMLLLSALINTLFAHTGKTILFKIPENWLLIGGNITLESLIYGTINGLVIGSLFLVFNIINQTLSIQQLTRLIPSAFHPISMMITIALTFFPSIQQRAQDIKEAQIIRGNPMTKVSDWLPLMVPLLVSSLENAILLSESMTTRNFHTRQTSISSDILIIGLLSATFAIFSGWILNLYDYPGYLSTLLYVAGASINIIILLITSLQSKVTRFHQETWQANDILSTILLTGIITGVSFAHLNNQFPTLTYTPYPGLSLPDLQLTGILLSLIPLTPLFFSIHD